MDIKVAENLRKIRKLLFGSCKLLGFLGYLDYQFEIFHTKLKYFVTSNVL